MKILIACEFSGTVRDAFRKREHDAWSCDLLQTESENELGYHLQGDVLNWIYGANAWAWDMMIAFPPCTHLAVSGARYFKNKVEDQKAAVEFVSALMSAPIKKIAIENPIGVISTKIRKPDQIIQPWQFGHPESKSTCLWLKNLPKLNPTNVCLKPSSGRWLNQTPTGQNKIGPSADRCKKRSKTYQGIADAMAEQWGRD